MQEYRFALLDPRVGPRARATNGTVFGTGRVWGVAVTVPALAARCEANIDPRHSRGCVTTTAIEAALAHPLPPAGTTIATVCPGLDAFGAMAVLAIRAGAGTIPGEALDRVRDIARAVKPRSQWRPGQDPERVFGRQALLVVVLDPARTVSDRVAAVRTWLETGSFPGIEAAAAEVRKLDREVRPEAGGRVAIIHSSSPFAIRVAYGNAPVVVAVHPEFRLQDGPPHRKVTIGQSEPWHVDLAAVCDELAARETGWGWSPTGIGPPTSIGSPRGRGCTIELSQIVSVVVRHLLP